MMTKRDRILDAAEAVFYRAGFHAAGIDRVVAEAGVTPRTLYRHFRSKEELVRAALARREVRYGEAFARAVERHAACHGDRLLAVFDALGDWLASEGDRGCMFLKALGEYTAHDPAITDAVAAHKRRALEDLRRRVAGAGLDPASGLPERLMVLMEGATALAPVLGAREAAAHARDAAARLIDDARRGGEGPL